MRKTRCIASKTLATVKRLLFRKNEQTRREGSPAASGLHTHGTARPVGTAHRAPPVLVEGPIQIARRAEEQCSPSAQAPRMHPDMDQFTLNGWARRRSLYAWRTSAASVHRLWLAAATCSHGMVTIYMDWCRVGQRSHMWHRLQAAVEFRDVAKALELLAGWFGLRTHWLQLVSWCGGL